MSVPGFVYALINPSMPKLVKVGRTVRNPVDRASELSSVTGIPTPFVVVYHEFFADCEAAEAYVHTALGEKGLRVSDVREFFSAEITDVINAIVSCPGKTSQTASSEKTNDDGWENLANAAFDRAFNIEHGLDGELQDDAEAANLYRQAARLGSTDALLMLGDMALDGGDGSLKDQRAAIDAYKQAIDKGNVYGYIRLAKVYLRQGHESNFRKCWSNFFSEFGIGTPTFSRFYDQMVTNQLWLYFFYHAINQWIVSEVPVLLHQHREAILSAGNRYVDEFKKCGSNTVTAKLALKLIRVTLFQEQAENISANITYEEVMDEYGFTRMAGTSTLYECTDSSTLKIQLLQNSWALDNGTRTIASGITAVDLANHLYSFFSQR